MNIEYLEREAGVKLAYRFYPAHNESHILQIVHGALEYSGRYDEMARWLQEHGISVLAMDNRGHGLNQEEGADRVVMEDMAAARIVEDVIALGRQFLKRKKPIILFGHSMGSFIARSVMVEDHPYAAFVLSGSGYQNRPTIQLALALTAMLHKRHGGDAFSKQLDAMSFDSLKKSMKRRGIIEEDIQWLSSDPINTEMNRADALLNQRFSISAYQAMFQLIERAHDRLFMSAMPKGTPILMLSGDRDPVGHYGKDLAKLSELYREHAKAHVSSILYPNMHHELTNEIERDQVYWDVLHFIKRIHDQ